MSLRLRRALRPFVCLITAAGFHAVATPALAGVYDSTVLADTPSMYWRFGENDGATTAADASGNGVTLNYTSAAILNTSPGVQNETDWSVAGDGSRAGRE